MDKSVIMFHASLKYARGLRVYKLKWKCLLEIIPQNSWFLNFSKEDCHSIELKIRILLFKPNLEEKLKLTYLMEGGKGKFYVSYETQLPFCPLVSSNAVLWSSQVSPLKEDSSLVHTYGQL